MYIINYISELSLERCQGCMFEGRAKEDAVDFESWAAA
jgi:hypothetical protein